MVIQLIHSFNSFTHSTSLIHQPGDFRFNAGATEKALTCSDIVLSSSVILFLETIENNFFYASDLRTILSLPPRTISRMSSVVLIPGFTILNGFSFLLRSFFSDLFLKSWDCLFWGTRIGCSSACGLLLAGVLKPFFCFLVSTGASWGRCFLTVD